MESKPKVISNQLLKATKMEKSEWYKSANITCFSETDVKSLIESLYDDPYYEALIAFLYETVAHQGEALEVRVKDIDWSKNSVLLVTFKQKKVNPVRVCPLSVGLLPLLKERVSKLGLTPEDYLFAKAREVDPVDRSSVP